MIRNHPEAIAIIAILLTMPCAYLIGSASREARSAVAPIHREIRRELRDNLQREKEKIRGEGHRLRIERDRLRHELRDEIRRALRLRTV